VADISRGIGPQQSEELVTGVWNLYTWQAIKPGLTLPDPNDDGGGAHWVWNEGIPEDIPVFEGKRVVLLWPRSYPRSWRAQRTFNLLPAELAIERRPRHATGCNACSPRRRRHDSVCSPREMMG
jgi:hypothetical protein